MVFSSNQSFLLCLLVTSDHLPSKGKDNGTLLSASAYVVHALKFYFPIPVAMLPFLIRVGPVAAWVWDVGFMNTVFVYHHKSFLWRPALS